MSWFSSRVGTRSGAAGGTRSADDLAAELEQQARSAGDKPPAVAAELLRSWLEQSEERSSATYGVQGDGAKASTPLQLGFQDALLRSGAFEALLESCARSKALREEALRRAPGVPGVPPSLLGGALDAAVERLLLPGAGLLWPGLLEALMANSESRTKGELCWEHWARRVLAALKRAWQSEALPSQLQELDRRLIQLAAGRRPDNDGAPGEEGASSETAKGAEELLRQGATRFSKKGIRAALAKEQLRRHTREAADLRERVELLRCMCMQLSSASAISTARAPKLRRLLQDADDALHSLDGVAKALHTEQESLSGSLGELGGELQRQISGVQMTRQQLFEKRVALEVERKALLHRLEEIDASMGQIGEQAEALASQERQLQDQLHGTSAHFEGKIGVLVCEQQALSEQKMRAVMYKESAHMALDVVAGHVSQREPELRLQLDKRRAELRRTLAALARAERRRLDDAGECAGVPEDAQEMAADFSLEAWGVVMRQIQTGREALEDDSSSLLEAGDAGAVEDRDTFSQTATPSVGQETGSTLDASAALEPQGPEDKRCVDCLEEGADWATVSHGTRLCTDCAGIHRGLGVHVSFVRSITMDRWSAQQIRLMRLGGNARFLQFLADYPPLCGDLASPATLGARYKSRAAAFYRRQLQAMCDGDSRAATEPPPTPGEGALPAVAARTCPSSGANGQFSGDAVGEEDADAAGTLEEELAALEAAYRDLWQRLGSSAGPS